VVAALRPQVQTTHPNYALVLLGEFIVHAGLAAAALCGAHSSPVWFYLVQIGGLPALGLAHAVIAAVMVLGAYWRWRLMRLALLVSISVYTLQTAFLTAGIVRSYVDPSVPRVAMESAFYGLGLVLLSLAAYREPLVPGGYADPDSPNQPLTVVGVPLTLAAAEKARTPT
jgi:hypothetical protein